jgi:hypothetical protein
MSYPHIKSPKHTQSFQIHVHHDMQLIGVKTKTKIKTMCNSIMKRKKGHLFKIPSQGPPDNEKKYKNYIDNEIFRISRKTVECLQNTDQDWPERETKQSAEPA